MPDRPEPAGESERPLEAVADWTPPSWDEVVRTHSARVYRLAYRLTGNPHDAEDLTQDVFVRVFRSLSTYTPGTFEGWLHRITTNLFLDQVRRKQRIRFDGLADDAADRLPGRHVLLDDADQDLPLTLAEIWAWKGHLCRHFTPAGRR
jgi:RNA polymerase sigma-70 factor (ECF subfamily)